MIKFDTTKALSSLRGWLSNLVNRGEVCRLSSYEGAVFQKLARSVGVTGEKKGRGVFFPLTPLKNRRLHKTPLFVEKMKDQR